MNKTTTNILTKLDMFTDILNEMEEFDFSHIEEIAKANNLTISSVDSKIDDGCYEDEEDEYVMLCSFYVTDHNTNNRIWVRMYYGDITLEIGYIDVQNM